MLHQHQQLVARSPVQGAWAKLHNVSAATHDALKTLPNGRSVAADSVQLQGCVPCQAGLHRPGAYSILVRAHSAAGCARRAKAACATCP